MKLSIITINYNNVEGLKKILASVAGQNYRDIEHIIIDGGSTDGSVEVIKEYAQRVNSEEGRVNSYEYTESI
jgi:glycosyltransferase involved in cell wall biosynthesis